MGAKMRRIDEIGRNYPLLDMTDLRILSQIGQTPGLSIIEIAEILRLDQRFVQQRLDKTHGLVSEDYNLADKRRRSLALTDLGENLYSIFEFLTK